MRILFENKIEHSTVAAQDGSLNYPADSIWHPFLRKKFKSEFGDDVLTIDLEEISDLNCFFMGYHNVDAGSVVFFDSGLSPIGSALDLADAEDLFVAYFSSISVRRIVVTIQNTAGNQVYVGGIGAGTYVQMPTNLTAGFDRAVSDDTVVDESPGGQTSRNKAASLRIRSFTFPDMDATERDRVDAPILALGIGKPVYVDIFEGDRTADAPMYAKFTEPRRITNPAARRYDLSIQLKEAR